MRAVVQRVSAAEVWVAGEVVGRIDHGFVVLLGISRFDTSEDANYLARKVTALRVFSDPEGKMNLSLADVSGSVLVVSQFTLYADTRKGNRPSFIEAAPADLGRRLYERFVELLVQQGLEVQTGVFQADMQVKLTNDGPVTLILDSSDRLRTSRS